MGCKWHDLPNNLQCGNPLTQYKSRDHYNHLHIIIQIYIWNTIHWLGADNPQVVCLCVNMDPILLDIFISGSTYSVKIDSYPWTRTTACLLNTNELKNQTSTWDYRQTTKKGKGKRERMLRTNRGTVREVNREGGAEHGGATAAHPEPRCPSGKASPSGWSQRCSAGPPLTPPQMSRQPETRKQTHTQTHTHTHARKRTRTHKHT